MFDYDVVVIGAGVQGAGVAQAVAAAGHSVLVLEKQQPAYGTSSRSSKLIHGGLRYLESAQFGLVRESLHERALMLKNAPELVKLQPFYIPLYPETRRKSWQIRTGLALYALLAGFGKGSGFGAIPRRQWDLLDGLKTEGLQQVFRYYDGQTDDALLTKAVLASSQAMGAETQMQAELLNAELRDEGVAIQYSESGQSREVTARVMVNASGPWVNDVLKRVTPQQPAQAVELVQGTHLVVPGELTHGLYYVESPRDGRAVFVMPWYGNTLVGTTESRYEGDPDQVKPLHAEVNYLLRTLAHYFPRYQSVDAEDVISSFAGLRVLPAGEGHAFHRSRETLLAVDRQPKPRLISIFGGKLTGWRANAEKVMARIESSLPVCQPRADTRHIRLHPH